MIDRIALEVVVAKSRKIHGDRYVYIRLERLQGKPLKIVCSCHIHGEFSIRAARHYTEGKGCPKCSTVTSLDEFVARAVKKHGNRYDYSQVAFRTLKDKVNIVCPVHGVFEQKANDHVLYYGCPECGVKARAKTKTKDTKWFIENSSRVHSNKYDYSKTKYTKAKNTVMITCPAHGDFTQKASAHVHLGHGCPDCSYVNGKTTSEFIRDAEAVHGDRYLYSLADYTGALQPVEILCRVHGSFIQSASNHLRGSGCPACSLTGFDVTKPGILYYLRLHTNTGPLYKIGITNLSVTQRFRVVEREIMTVLQEHLYERGQDAADEEEKILEQYREYLYQGAAVLHSGNTEIFTKDVLGLDT